MGESYEELMLPLFQRLSGSGDNVITHSLPQTAKGEAVPGLPSTPSMLQDEATAAMASAYRAATMALEQQVLAFVYAQTPAFFERLIIDLLLAMGYAGRRRDLAKHLGRSHDGGVDGIISQDPLGLDIILVQAKRLKPNSTISSSQMRDFIGTLETKRASKGIFVTTGDFSAFARSSLQTVSRRVRVVNGQELSALMVRHNIGVTPTQSFVFKTLDRRYFATGPNVPGKTTSFSSQPAM
jgi:restriction system protein